MNELTQIIDDMEDLTNRLRALVELKDTTTPEPKPEKWPKPTFGGRRAPWCVPSSLVATHSENLRYKQEFWNMCDGSMNLNLYDWAITVHQFDKRTPRVVLSVQRPDWCNMMGGETIPWRDEWRIADDSDAYTTIWNPADGECFLMWQPVYDQRRRVMTVGTANVVTSTVWPDRKNPKADIRFKDNGFLPSRACGIAQPTCLTTRQEVENGLIPHVLAVGVPNPSRGVRFAPATKNIGVTGSPGTGRCGTGMRLAFDRTPEAVFRDWILGLRSGGKISQRGLESLEVIGRAAIDYGVMIVDNGGNRARKTGGIQFEDDISAGWADVGLDNSAEVRTALYSLFKMGKDHSRVLATPNFLDADINETAMYAGVDYV